MLPAKVLERLVLPHIDDAINLQPTQHGFRKHHSTCTEILSLITDVDGFCQKKPAPRTVMVALDPTAAFDTVNHNTISKQMAKLDAAPQSAQVGNHGLSAVKNPCTDVAKEGLLSPSLFNLYMYDLPIPPNNVKVMRRREDICIVVVVVVA